ncbi:MAG: GNAT family N-acetyltransferase [Oscillospiraceae bacterium]|jgi:GNAT superfamily N-acetyltransferase|nr:GNAT family N-acetyltransferase [Oscillospiraceae bacterium]
MCIGEIQFKHLTSDELEDYWHQCSKYMKEDILPNSNPQKTDEEAKYFLSAEYRDEITGLFKRERNRLRINYIYLNDKYAGFITYVLYDDMKNKYFGECFILEYCIEKSQRGAGVGTCFFEHFEAEMKRQGAQYFALNTTNERNRKFWMSLGFVMGRNDEFGNPVYFKR